MLKVCNLVEAAKLSWRLEAKRLKAWWGKYWWWRLEARGWKTKSTLGWLVDGCRQMKSVVRWMMAGCRTESWWQQGVMADGWVPRIDACYVLSGSWLICDESWCQHCAGCWIEAVSSYYQQCAGCWLDAGYWYQQCAGCWIEAVSSYYQHCAGCWLDDV